MILCQIDGKAIGYVNTESGVVSWIEQKIKRALTADEKVFLMVHAEITIDGVRYDYFPDAHYE